MCISVLSWTARQGEAAGAVVHPGGAWSAADTLPPHTLPLRLPSPWWTWAQPVPGAQRSHPEVRAGEELLHSVFTGFQPTCGQWCPVIISLVWLHLLCTRTRKRGNESWLEPSKRVHLLMKRQSVLPALLFADWASDDASTVWPLSICPSVFQESGRRASSQSARSVSEPLLRCSQRPPSGGWVPGRQVCVCATCHVVKSGSSVLQASCEGLPCCGVKLWSCCCCSRVKARQFYQTSNLKYLRVFLCLVVEQLSASLEVFSAVSIFGLFVCLFKVTLQPHLKTKKKKKVWLKRTFLSVCVSCSDDFSFPFTLFSLCSSGFCDYCWSPSCVIHHHGNHSEFIMIHQSMRGKSAECLHTR